MLTAKYVYLLLFVLLLLTGCSSSNGSGFLTQPAHDSFSDSSLIPVGVIDRLSDGTPSEGFGAMGLFSLQINQSDMTAELATLRKSSLTDVLEVVDISNFLQMAPCHDCAKVKSVALNNDGNLVVSIGIKHPFPAGDLLKPITGQNRADLHVFNVEGIVISNIDASAFPGIEKSVAGFRLLNADGFTGYLDGVLDDIYPTAASVHPYITHFDDYSTGNYDPMSPTGFTSVVDPPPSGNLVMAMGCDYDYQDYIFNVDGSFDFIFAVGCTYAVSAMNKSQRFSPEYRVPQHNKKAASEVTVEVVSNDLEAGNTSSSATLRIHVVDINHGVAVGTALNEMLADSSVSAITVEVPEITSGSSSIPSVPIGGTGHDPSDPLIFEGAITNSAGGAEGTYMGLVQVTDSYTPGLNQSPLLNGQDGIQRVDPLLNPLNGLFAITKFTTYQIFSIDVVSGALITVITPNGGEAWAAGSDQEITWTSQNVTGTVFIEYSKDNFIADIHPIAADEANDDSFMWENIPNDPSDTVRVRISSTDDPGVNDISDEDFRIFSILWHDEGLIYHGGQPSWDDTDPALVTDGTGTLYLGFFRCQLWVDYVGTWSYTIPAFAESLNNGLTFGNVSTGGWQGHKINIVPHYASNLKMTLGSDGHCFSAYIHHSGIYTNSKPAIDPWLDSCASDGSCAYCTEFLYTDEGYPMLFRDRNGTIKMRIGPIPNVAGTGTWPTFYGTEYQLVDDGYLSKVRSGGKTSDGRCHLMYWSPTAGRMINYLSTDDINGHSWPNDEVVFSGTTGDWEGARDPSLWVDEDDGFHTFFGADTSLDQIHLMYGYSSDGTNWEFTDIAQVPESDGLNETGVVVFNAIGMTFVWICYETAGNVYCRYKRIGDSSFSSPIMVNVHLNVTLPDLYPNDNNGIVFAYEADGDEDTRDIFWRLAEIVG